MILKPTDSSQRLVSWSLKKLINPETDHIILLNVRPSANEMLSMFSQEKSIVKFEEDLKFKSHVNKHHLLLYII